ncbi:AraC family transcriptional regulator [Trinickia mobilis]|uniref:AraC family transcriptional regulator n=1 Tax=Trinickia mobilis TaxID=2816356 RepID=UPI001A8D5EBE|nr:AraC family transcriptional regulator [Trinickia mobilis]
MRASNEFSRYRAVGGARGIEALHAQFMMHRFAPHVHDSWAIGGVLEGVKDNGPSATSSNVVRKGELTILPPGHVHAGKAVGNRPYQYVMIYVSDDLMQARARHCGFARVQFSSSAIPAAEIVVRLASFVRATLNLPLSDQSSQEVVAACEALLEALIVRHGHLTPPGGDPPPASAEAGLSRARRFLLEHWDQPISLDHLAREAALSPYYFCRQFGRLYGLTPHRYQQVLRLARARNLIIRGASVTEAAAATGFADQSHLGRQFRSCYGYSPGSLILEKPSIAVTAQ